MAGASTSFGDEPVLNNINVNSASKNHTKVVTRHVWQEYYEEAEHLRYVPEHHELYELRKQTIERNFADLKEKHGLH